MESVARKMLFSRVESYEKQMVQLASRLISIDTSNPPGKNYLKIIEILESEFRKLGFSVRKYPSGKAEPRKSGPDLQRQNLVAFWDTGSSKTLHLNGHFDVVPASDRWKDAFAPMVSKGKLYGRGSYDMKSQFACYITALKCLKDMGVVPGYNIEVSCTADEETGSRLGMEMLVKNRLVNADAALGEAGSGRHVCIGNKGTLWLDIEVIGKAAHAAYEHRGVNSFEKAAVLAAELLSLKKKLRRRKTRYPTKEKVEKHPTMVLGGSISGGNKTNVVPEKTVFSIDRRINPEETISSAKNEIMGALRSFRKRNRDVRINVVVKASSPPAIAAPDNEISRLFAGSVRQVLGRKARYFISAGGTDLRFFLRKGIPSLGYNPEGKNLHADNEHVYVKSMVSTAKIFAHFMAVI